MLFRSQPVLRAQPNADGSFGAVKQAPATGRFDPEDRIYARSASDDKSPIVAMLAALDGMRATGQKPSVNLKFYLEGEEEAGSTHLKAMLERYKTLLAADGLASVIEPPGVDLSVFAPRPNPESGPPLVVAMARPRTPRRGFATVVAALEECEEGQTVTLTIIRDARSKSPKKVKLQVKLQDVAN